jgi:hypothetical protein
MAILLAGMLYSANPTVERTVTAKSAVPAAYLRTLALSNPGSRGLTGRVAVRPAC